MPLHRDFGEYHQRRTNQLQGEEMNRLWHSHLRIRELFDVVDRTCDQINEVFTQENLKKTYGGRLTLLDEVSEAMARARRGG